MISSWKQLSEYKYTHNSLGGLKNRQEAWLYDIIKRNSNTEFGRKYLFNKIHDVNDYRDAVPISTFDDLSVFINKVEKGESDILFSGNAVAFERTSGSSRGQKLIPYSNESLLDFRNAILPWLSELTQHYNLESGSAYWAISPATRQAEVTSGGIPVGIPDAAYLGEDVIPFFQNISAVPHWVGAVASIHDWQLATLYYLVCSRDLVLISVWSPTFLVTLMDVMLERQQELERILLNGTTIGGQYLAPNPLAHAILEKYYRSRTTQILWPDLKLISCWADASSAPFYQQLTKLFPDIAIQPKGLLLTEGVVTVPNQNNQTVLAADSGFYEFLDSKLNSKLAHELIKGQRYEVVMTTSGGLYRYRTYDIVVCEGYTVDMPILRFTGRGNCSSDFVGEKLTDDFVSECLEGISGFRMLIPVQDKKPGYLLVLDKQRKENISAIVDIVETRLFNNPQYAYACKVGQLKRLKTLLVDNPLEMYLTSPAHNGTPLGDIKVPSLCTKTGIFDSQIEAAA